MSIRLQTCGQYARTATRYCTVAFPHSASRTFVGFWSSTGRHNRYMTHPVNKLRFFFAIAYLQISPTFLT